MGTFSNRYKVFAPYPADVFVETGTCRGESVRAALTMDFKEIHSIEFSPVLFRSAMVEIVDPKVTFHHGSSPAVLERLLPQFADRFVVLWLDAHYQGEAREEQEDSRYGECPLLAEIEAIKTVHWRIPPMLVIDDCQMFEDEYWVSGETRAQFKREQWPTLKQIHDALPGAQFSTNREQLYCYSAGGF